jgi:hypothetical protein
MYPKTLKEIADPTVRARIATERKIVNRLIDTALAAGFELSVFDGEEAFPWTTHKAAVLRDIMNTDEDVLHLRKPGRNAARSSVLLVYGNDGWDVIADYSVSLEEVLQPVNAYALTLEA